MVTYSEAGVDLRMADEVGRRIGGQIRRTWTPRVLSSPLGGFAGLFQLDYPKGLLARRYRDPILVGGTDGVGSKTEIAFRMGVLDTIGIDLVAMCVNDVVAQGAEPLFFLDYVAVGKKDPDRIDLLLKGLTAGCREAGCALLGGETAELPGMYAQGRFEMAGFAIGVVERSRLIPAEGMGEGDEILGLASSGIHAHGLSLVRKIFFEGRRWDFDRKAAGQRRSLGEELLEPTRIYAREILAILGEYHRKRPVRAIAHIGGGGLPRNLSRVLPAHLDAVLQLKDWPVPAIFRLIQETGKVPDDEMFAVFNMGIGMAMVVSPHFTDSILQKLADLGCPAWRIGRIVRGKNRVILR